MSGGPKGPNSKSIMKKQPTKGEYGMIEASKKEIEYFESFEGEAVDLQQIITQSKVKKPSATPKRVVARR